MKRYLASLSALALLAGVGTAVAQYAPLTEDSFFAITDRDGDGLVDRDEYHAGNFIPPYVQMDELFTDSDQDHDGLLDQDEYHVARSRALGAASGA